GCYYAKMAVTSTSGETQHASKPFTTGKPYTIRYAASSNKINSDAPYLLPIRIYDADSKTVDNIELKWKLKVKGAENPTVLSGIIISGKNETVDFSSLKSDIYALSVEPVDTTLANAADNLAELSLYSIKNNTMPTADDIFVPKEEYMTDNNGEVEILFGTPGAHSYIYTALGSLMQVNSINLEEFAAGFHYVKVKLPEDAKEGLVKIFTTIKGETTMINIEIKRPDRRKITLEGSSMRDRLSPGTPERWTLKLTDVDGMPIAGAMLATMFNSSLNSLDYYSLPGKFDIQEKPIGLYDSKATGFYFRGHITGKIKFLETLDISYPQFYPSLNYYYSIIGGKYMEHKRFLSSLNGQVSGLKTTVLVTEDEAFVANAQARSSVADEEEEYEIEEEDGVVLSDDMSFDIIAPEEIPAKGMATETSGAPDPEFEYRPSEVLQAFWMPELLINEDGETEIAFTTPNANTTWSFNAFAWTKDLRATTMIREFVAAKPVMV
ncbi:MAG: hypothetical protein K2K82_01830, partial [Muribaculaceae bacterium]|nr:hypothetical protein [Muribaculaceae bacterium]